MHNRPKLPVGQFCVRSGAMMAGGAFFDIDITGVGAHGARPEAGIDSLMVGVQIASTLQTIVSRNVRPVDTAVVSVTQFHAGDAYNILPEKAHLAGTIRAFSDAVRDQAVNALRRIAKGVAETYGIHVAVDVHYGYPATVNTQAEAALCRSVAEQVLGRDQVITGLNPSMGAEDFAFMLQQKPGCYVWLANGPGEGGCMLHNPKYDFNDDVMATGVKYWVGLVERCLGGKDGV
jgi:hippurate hydrolase